jgi:hypothetical protein
MVILKADEIYERQIKELPPQEQLRLLMLVAQGLANRESGKPGKKHSVLEFAGAGAADPVGMDAQEYVNMLRAEWDHRP